MGIPSAIAVAFSAAVMYAARIPAGTEIQIRLQTPIAASTATIKQAVEAIVIAPVLVNGEEVIFGGSTLSGSVSAVNPAAKDQRAILLLAFTRLSHGTTSVMVSARVTNVDNARESVNDKGAITGIMASETMSSRLDQGISKITERYPGLGGLLELTKGAMVSETDADISYPAGVELTLQLETTLTWTDPAGHIDLIAIRRPEALAELVNSQPLRTMAENPSRPSDITNLMFLGSREDLQAAFTAAGWSTAGALSDRSRFETARAIIEMRGYKDAPVSVLLLDGRVPEMVFQKQNNTFAQRHHLRIWHRPETFDGHAVWVCSATHDTGIEFSEESRTFIHKIDPHIDAERSKVVSDLLLTGKIKAIALVDRPAVPMDARNATGDELVTDGKIVVLQF